MHNLNLDCEDGYLGKEHRKRGRKRSSQNVTQVYITLAFPAKLNSFGVKVVASRVR